MTHARVLLHNEGAEGGVRCTWSQDSVLENNTVTGQGGAFHVLSGQGTRFTNVTFSRNSGALRS